MELKTLRVAAMGGSSMELSQSVQPFHLVDRILLLVFRINKPVKRLLHWMHIYIYIYKSVIQVVGSVDWIHVKFVCY